MNIQCIELVKESEFKSDNDYSYNKLIVVYRDSKDFNVYTTTKRRKLTEYIYLDQNQLNKISQLIYFVE